jgi:hypothetical protein
VYEFSSLALEEMHRIRLSEDWVMRKIFWSKWNKIKGDMRKLHHEELHHPYSSSNTYYSRDQIQVNELDEAYRKYRREEKYIRGFDGET